MGLAAGRVAVAIWSAIAMLLALVVVTVAAGAISSTTVIGGGAAAGGCQLAGQEGLDPEQATNARSSSRSGSSCAYRSGGG